MSNLVDFVRENNALRSLFHAAMDEEHRERYVIYDGPINIERYLSSPIKISWFLKEPYEEQDGSGGGWGFTDLFDKENLYNEEFKKPHKATWQPVIYCTYGILRGFWKWDDMPYIWNEPEMCDAIRSIAIVNAQKLPSLGYSKTDFTHIEASYNKHKDLLHKQIDLLKPDVSIFASTFGLYRDALGITEEHSFRKTSVNSYVKDGKLYLDAYHPAQTQVTRQVYVDDIISAVEEWKLGVA